MARTASMTTQEAESILGTRGSIRVDSTNRHTVRKWLVAMGLPSGFVAGLSMTELGIAYNDTTGAGLQKLRDKLAESADLMEDEKDDESSKTLSAESISDGQPVGSVEQAIAALVQGLTPKAAPIDESIVRKIVAEAISGIPSKTLNIKVNDTVLGSIEGRQHPNFESLLKACCARNPYSGFVENIFIQGEASSGKTTGAKNVAKVLNLKWRFNGAISMPHEMLGFIDAGGTYHRTPFRDAYEHGGVYTFDEVDRSDPIALLAVNPHLANGVAEFPDGQVVRHKDCIIIGTANTWGLGADANYSGATKLDGAFMSRFPIRINWDIDESLERDICGNPAWAKRVQAARAKARQAGIKVMIDVRMSIAGAALIGAGFTESQAANMTYLANLKPDQRRIVES